VILLMLWLYIGGFMLLVGAEINSEIEHAAAMRGAATAKAKGERAPGDASTARDERKRDEVLLGARALTAADVEAATEKTAVTVARTATGVAVGVRALPWVATWGAAKVVARTFGLFARRSVRMPGELRRRRGRDRRAA
jgi:hypothetical protein